MAGAGVRDTLIEGPWDHRYVMANGVRFHLAGGRSLAPGRPLVLLLHGFGEFWWAWRHLLPVLDEAGYGVAAMDLRGYGASDKTPRGYDPHTSAGDVAGVIRGLGSSSAVLVGHDWGGMLAWSTAAYAPARVAGLVGLAAPHPLAFPWWHYRRPLAFFQIPIAPERRLMAEDGAYVERLLRSWAAPGSDFLSAEDARHYRDALVLWPSPHSALEYQRMFVRDRLRRAGRSYRRALRRRTRFPVLSIHGSLDPLLPASAVAAVSDLVDGRHELLSLPGVGHLPHEEDPDAVGESLLRWLPGVAG